MENKVLVVVGPTAVGKTALGVKLAHEFDGEIISGDSQQVYRGLDIGTAKVTPLEMEGVTHHLIDIREITENFSAHDFVTAANTAITDITARGKLPIIVGGTGLYIQALIEGYHLGGEENHQQMQRLRETLETLTNDELQSRLKQPLPEFNRRRAIRALELETYGSGENKPTGDEFCLIGLTTSREQLYERINLRAEKMIDAGLLTEAELLYKNYRSVQAAKAIGYKEFFPYFAGDITLEEAVERLKQDSRHYAKRQLTWFRNRMKVDFIDIFSPNFPENAIMIAKEFLKIS
ncbi:tRNA (adenosine(37)-N6)-dimethylallyltransferase MiaA [Lactovum odontotermitis]